MPEALGIGSSRRSLLREIEGSSDVTLLVGPGNIGDQLIAAGARQLLSGAFYTERLMRRRKEGGFVGLEEGVGGHTALVIGGGGWCRPFNTFWPVLLPLIEERFEKVVVLPSSVDSSAASVRGALEMTSATVFAREQESHRQLEELCRARLAHDTAFFFDFSPYRRRGHGLLRAYRTDKEAASDRPLPAENDDISVSCASLDHWLWTIARHESVETDRAHVMIAAAMLGKQVRYRSSSYHKVPAIARYALRRRAVEPLLESA